MARMDRPRTGWRALFGGLVLASTLSAVAQSCTTYGGRDDADAGPPLPPLDAETTLDAAPSDASPADAGPPCTGVARGTASPCTSCKVTPIHTIPAPDGGAGDASAQAGPFTFGVAVDAAYVYWIEQSGGSAPYDGVGARAVLKRKAHGALANAPAETMSNAFSVPYTRVAVTEHFVWLASGSRSGEIVRVSKCASAPCQSSPVATPTTRVGGLVAFRDAVVVAADGAITTYTEGDSSSSTTVRVGVNGLAHWQGGHVYTSEGSGPGLVEGTSTTPLGLLQTDPTAPAYPAYGANGVAASCDTVWARQIFRELTDAGAIFHAAIVRATPGAAKGFAFQRLVFAMQADATHAYLALPDKGGLARVDRDADGAFVAVPSVSPWSLAITDDAVYFDDHGTGGRSIGIFAMKKD